VDAKQSAPDLIPARAPTTDAGRDPLTGETVPHKRTEKVAGQVEAMAALGFTVEEVAVALDLRPGQVRQHYARELAAAPVKANMQVAKAFFDVAKSGKNWQASASWLRARAGWAEGDVGAGGGGISITIHL
jgi:hypothetical protein